MSIPLSEQIGALGLVDELRHREMAIQEHLDLPRRRAEVAEGIRTYYQSNGIAFDEATVEEGVREFFSRRLEFEAPPLNFMQRLLTRLALGYRSLLKWVVYTVLLIAVGVASPPLLDYYHNSVAAQEADQLDSELQQLQEATALQRQRLEQSKARLVGKPDPTVADLLAKIEKLLPNTSKFSVTRPDPITPDNRRSFHTQVAAARIGIRYAQKDLDSARRRLNRVDHYYASLDLLRQQQDRLKGMPLAAADRQQLADWLNGAKKDIARLQLKLADTTLARVTDYLDFAAEPLTLELVDRPGIKSGVERCYEASGCSENSTRGKSWYLIVEALDGAGKLSFVPVTSVEDNTTRWAQRFGVRVSRDEYLRVRQDKLDDGHISPLRIGYKAANSLDLHFTQRTSASPDMILEW